MQTVWDVNQKGNLVRWSFGMGRLKVEVSLRLSDKC
jgi:hypothetical protein